MKRIAAIALSCLLLTGCSSVLERTYTTSELHSSKFWEGDAANILRAESYQDIVNDLLILVDQHAESNILRLYDFEDSLIANRCVERAALEVQQETPLGAYAVEYITYTSQEQKGYFEISVQIGYRRTAEQIQSIVNITSVDAVYTLLEAALENGREEEVVSIGYWDRDSLAAIGEAIEQLRADRNLQETAPWVVNCYPDTTDVGIVEFLLNEDLPVTTDDEEPASEAPEDAADEAAVSEADASAETEKKN